MATTTTITCAKRCVSEKAGGCLDANCRDNCALRAVPANGFLQFDAKLAEELHAFEKEEGGHIFKLPMPQERETPLCLYHYGRWLESWGARLDTDDDEDEEEALRRRCFKWVPVHYE